MQLMHSPCLWFYSLVAVEMRTFNVSACASRKASASKIKKFGLIIPPYHKPVDNPPPFSKATTLRCPVANPRLPQAFASAGPAPSAHRASVQLSNE